ncbi:twin-arginine translocase TatA/TatE family subunit [Candidatus Poribacteria bacterium]|nr:twin-arginine translocase TatA/TatE family subunit [Candidatus Poribacteria bacterium]
MLGLGPTELLIVLFIVLLLFGAKRLPELARGLGQSIVNFKSSMNTESNDDEEKGETNDSSRKM